MQDNSGVWNESRFLQMQDNSTAWTELTLLAKILVKAVVLVLQVVGIQAHFGRETIQVTCENITEEVKKSSAAQKAIQTFIAAWEKADGCIIEQAKAIICLLKDTYAAGILRVVIKSLCSNLNGWDWFVVCAKVSTMIIATFASEGFALMAKVAQACLAARDLASDIIAFQEFCRSQKQQLNLQAIN